MLEIKGIKKYYQVGESLTKALDGVSVSFREQEFVAILGPSGSGKTTLLNVIGGLDNYDSGDMVINGQSTESFKESDWDAYRNNSVGFVFQSYNLISHLGILDNVELGMTLSGVPKEEKRLKAEDALIRVGLKEHMHKKPNQLSGGQMQRVAIARALANDPDILLCDEPTGALDTETSVQIMALIKELSEEKLVVMVTHNPELAHEYADRIIQFSDGRIESDSHPFNPQEVVNNFELKHTKMTFWTALKLSFNNIKTKKGRTILTSFASSIGIIGVAIVLSLSYGFQKQIDHTQAETLAQFPVTISQVSIEQDQLEKEALGTSKGSYPSQASVIPKVSAQNKAQHINQLDEDYVTYIENIDPDLSHSIGFTRAVGMNLLREIDGKATPVSFSNSDPDSQTVSTAAMMSSMTGVGVSTFPIELSDNRESFLQENYDVLVGAYPQSPLDVVLIVDSNNQTDINGLKNLGFEVSEDKPVDFNDIVGTTIKLIHNDAYYTELPTGNFLPNTDYDSMYEAKENKEIKVTGVLRGKPKATMNLLYPGLAYSNKLALEIIEENQASAIVTAQKESPINVMTNEKIDDLSKKNMLVHLGGDSTPSSIMIYPNSFETKEDVLTYLDDYNAGKDKKDRVLYQDLAGTMTDLTGGLMDAITYVLIAFAGISLVTSMIMISIITYTSVIERTKEIGVLKALGARKKDITRVFDAETFILGVTSGILGVIIAYGATFPINHVILKLTDLEHVAQLNPIHGVILVVVSTILTMLGGHIPAKMAAKKDAAIALRAE